MTTTRDYDYITLYMPLEGPTGDHPGSRMLSQQCEHWLAENVGQGTTDYREWLVCHDQNKFQWCYRGFDHTPGSDYTKICRIFCFRDQAHAIMFKLTWGG